MIRSGWKQEFSPRISLILFLRQKCELFVQNPNVQFSMERTLMVLSGRQARVEIFQWKTNCFLHTYRQDFVKEEERAILR